MDLNLCNFFCCWGNSFEQSIFKHLLFADFLLWNKKSSFRECFFNIFIASWIFFNSFLHSSHLFLPSRSIFFTFVSPSPIFSPHQSNNPNILFFVCLFSLFFSSTFCYVYLASFFLKSPEQFNMFLELQEKLIN